MRTFKYYVRVYHVGESKLYLVCVEHNHIIFETYLFERLVAYLKESTDNINDIDTFDLTNSEYADFVDLFYFTDF